MDLKENLVMSIFTCFDFETMPLKGLEKGVQNSMPPPLSVRELRHL